MFYAEKKSNAIRNTFKAYERLKREQHIDTLFRMGKAFSVFPLKVIYRELDRAEHELSPVRAGFSIPKKKFRKSVQRNRIKRLLREAWRLNKQSLYSHIPDGQQLHLFIIFTAQDIPQFPSIEEAIRQMIERLKKQIFR